MVTLPDRVALTGSKFAGGAPFSGALVAPERWAHISAKPSEYIKRQVWATFIKDSIFINGLEHFGADNIMWSSDYPHLAATIPRSQEFVEKTFSSLPMEQRRKIVHDTAARVYGIAE